MRTLLRVAVVLMIAGPGLASGQTIDAARVLADMRGALGGADRIAAVKTLTASGTSQRVTPRGTTENAVEVAIELPDKFRTRTVVAGEGSMSVYRNAGFNGGGPINEIDAPPNLNQAMRSRIDGAGDRPREGGGKEPTAEEQAERGRRQLLNQKKEFARLALGMLGSSYDAFPLQFSYAGEAESADGTAHVIEVRGEELAARLFVDTKSNLPLMLMWTEPRGGAGAGTTLERRLY